VRLTTVYAYDADSNLVQKVAPAPNQTGTATVTTTYTYDALNRPLDRSYSDTTPTASFRYDYSSFLGHSLSSPVGRGVAALTANGTISSFVSYDPMGRVASTVQCNPGAAGCKTSGASYDQLGDPTSVAYPANSFSVTYGYDNIAALLISATDSNGVTYANSPTYLASGAMQEFVSPNFNGFKYHVDYNKRLQPTEIWAGSAQGAGALFDKQYSYNAPNTAQMNNGNVYTVTNVKDDLRTQSFTYDALNRLLTAGDKTHWSNYYTYDPWGNLYQKVPGAPAGENMFKSADSNNRLSGLSYDSAGNVIVDDQGNTLVYDAENRIISTTNNTSGTTTYTYGAGGQRITKSTGATVANYWFGPSGDTLAETDSSGNFTNYVFFGGQRLARNVSGDIKYYITDHLHSTAIFADKSGTVLDDNDFYPWGGVVPGVGTTSSNNHYKFTGKERDTESQLDYFGARYYANATGRFLSPDWAAKPTSVPYAEFGDPQSLNLYSYVRNSPIVRVDPDGHNDVAGWDGAYANKGGGFGPTDTTDEGESQREPDEGQQTQIQQPQPAQVTPVQQPAAQQPSAQPSGPGPTQPTQPAHGHWEYSQTTGQMVHVLADGTRVSAGTGYSGRGAGQNNPGAQYQSNTGPIPQGDWRIGPQQDNVTRGPHPHTLAASMRLESLPGTVTRTRAGFLIHGDNARGNNSASTGCVVLDRTVRDQIGRSGDNVLRVVP
jgi:RHS repeat-associated protein